MGGGTGQTNATGMDVYNASASLPNYSSSSVPSGAGISVNNSAPGWGGSSELGGNGYTQIAGNNGFDANGVLNATNGIGGSSGGFDLGGIFGGMGGQGGGMGMGQMAGVVGLASKLLDLGGGKEKAAGGDMKTIGVGPMSPRISGSAFEYKSPYDPQKNPSAAQAYDSMWKNMVSQGIQNNLLKFQDGRLIYA